MVAYSHSVRHARSDSLDNAQRKATSAGHSGLVLWAESIDGMRSLTPAEARVIHTLLVDRHAGDAQGIRSAGVPRSTFQSIRRRAILSGWLKERYIPDPRTLGLSTVRFRLAVPFADHWREALQLLRTPETVFLSASPGIMFSVEFGKTGRFGDSGSGSEALFRSSWHVESQVGGDEILAYFDFEGAWARWALGVEPTAYPRAFGGAKGAEVPGTGKGVQRQLNATRDLVARAFEVGSIAETRLMVSARWLPRRLRRLLETGVVVRRLIPDFAEMPSVRGERIEEVVFVTARRGDRSPAKLFEDLARESKSTPFLFAYDRERVLFASLAPARPTLRQDRVPIIDVLGKYVEGVEVLREKVGSILTVVDHRYDRAASFDSR